jgi:hypothetical protein
MEVLFDRAWHQVFSHLLALGCHVAMLLCCKDQTDYSNLQTMIKTFEPYNNLWKTAGDWVSNKEANMK